MSLFPFTFFFTFWYFLMAAASLKNKFRCLSRVSCAYDQGKPPPFGACIVRLLSLSARLLAFIRRDDSSTNKQTNKQTTNSRLFSHLRQEKDDSPKNQQKKKKKKNADTQKANQAERSLKLFCLSFFFFFLRLAHTQHHGGMLAAGGRFVCVCVCERRGYLVKFFSDPPTLGAERPDTRREEGGRNEGKKISLYTPPW